MLIKSELYDKIEKRPSILLHILWVDDIFETEFLQDILEDADIGKFELTHCVNLTDGLDAVKARHYNVTLLDLILPDTQGLDTLIRMRKVAEEIPIVVMAAIEDKAMGLQAVRIGAQDYLLKSEMNGKLLGKAIHYAIERNRAEKALQYTNEHLKIANKKLKSLDNMKDEFIALVSHELRTPLCSILGYAETIMECELNPDEHDQFIQVIIEESERLTRLIEKVLNLSKMAAGTVKLNLAQVELDIMMKNVLQSIYVLAVEKQISLEFKSSEIKFIGDQDCIKEVLINIIGNAIKFSPQGGTIYINHQERGREFTISVRDEGPGIPQGYLDKIFERFQQVQDSRVKHKGSGLGLAIAKYFIEAHNGKIWVENTGTGAMFLFTLPFKN